MESHPAADEVLSAPYVYEYVYRRSVGPVVGRFLSPIPRQQFPRQIRMQRSERSLGERPL